MELISKRLRLLYKLAPLIPSNCSAAIAICSANFRFSLIEIPQFALRTSLLRQNNSLLSSLGKRLRLAGNPRLRCSQMAEF
jgi:hypothetical protein